MFQPRSVIVNKLNPILISLVFSSLVSANEQPFDSNKFASDYFSAWQATQCPDASKEDIENYLQYLLDDVGHQHLPYDTDSTRKTDAKQSMRKGMMYYLGAHSEYKA